VGNEHKCLRRDASYRSVNVYFPILKIAFRLSRMNSTSVAMALKNRTRLMTLVFQIDHKHGSNKDEFDLGLNSAIGIISNHDPTDTRPTNVMLATLSLSSLDLGSANRFLSCAEYLY